MRQPKSKTRNGCPATLHDTYSAYTRGCRCPTAREDWRLYNKRRRENRAPTRRVNSIGAGRRVQALMAIGHTAATIGAHANIDRADVRRLYSQPGRQILQDTHAAIVAAFNALSGAPGKSARTLRHARRCGWPPPLAWDDDTIDDPDTVPNLGSSGSDIVDEVAVAKAACGELTFGQLVPAEQVELYRRHRTGRGHGTLTRVWNVSTARLRQIAALAEVA